jgi:hypothetical protein
LRADQGAAVSCCSQRKFWPPWRGAGNEWQVVGKGKQIISLRKGPARPCQGAGRNLAKEAASTAAEKVDGEEDAMSVNATKLAPTSKELEELKKP